MIEALTWIGARAQWMLALGIALAFVAPDLTHALRPALPYLVPLVLGMAMARVDLAPLLRDALRLRAALGLLALSALLMPVSAAVYLAVAWTVGLDPDLRIGLLYLAVAPPIASAANLCFILGYDARRALEVTVAATLLTPLLGPLTVAAFLGPAAHLAAGALALKLGLMIAGGVAVGVAIRRLAGPERILRRRQAFDALAVIAMVIFVLPLFDGVPAMIAADPGRAALVLLVATIANLGVNFGVRAGAAPFLLPASAGAYGLLFGNRTIAIYLAALPHDAQFTLFVAFYQVPMLLTPLIARMILSHTRN